MASMADGFGGDLGFPTKVESQCVEIPSENSPIKSFSFAVEGQKGVEEGSSPSMIDCCVVFFSNVIHVTVTETGKAGVQVHCTRKVTPLGENVYNTKTVFGRRDVEHPSLYATEIAKLFFEGPAKEGFTRVQSLLLTIDVRSEKPDVFRSVIAAFRDNLRL